MLVYFVRGVMSPLYAAQLKILGSLGVRSIPVVSNTKLGSAAPVLIPCDKNTFKPVTKARPADSDPLVSMAIIMRRYLLVPNYFLCFYPGVTIQNSDRMRKEYGTIVASNLFDLLHVCDDPPLRLSKPKLSEIITSLLQAEIGRILHDLRKHRRPELELRAEIISCLSLAFEEGHSSLSYEAAQSLSLDELVKNLCAVRSLLCDD